MTIKESERYNFLLTIYNNDPQILELLDLVIKDYNDRVLEKIQSGENHIDISAMSAGVTNLRNALAVDLKKLEKGEN